MDAAAALGDAGVAVHRVAHGLGDAHLHALHRALLACIRIHVGVIRHRARQHCGLEGHRRAQVVGLQGFGDPVVQLLAAVHGDAVEAHAAAAPHQIILRAGDLPIAPALGTALLRVVDDVRLRVAIEQPVGHVQLAHLGDAVAAVQEYVRQQALALEVRLKLLLRILLRDLEGNHLLRLHAARDALGQDGGAAAVGALRGGGGVLGHQLRAATLADIGLHLRRLARVEGLRAALKFQLVDALGGAHGLNRIQLVAVAAGCALQLAALAAEGQRRAAAGAVICSGTHNRFPLLLTY